MASLQPQTGTLGKRLAKHLLRRATFNYTKANIDTYSTMTVGAAVDALFNFTGTTPALAMNEPVDPGNNSTPWINSGSKGSTGEFRLRDYVRCWWLNEAMHDATARHKMMFFLHGIFCIHSDLRTSEEFFDYLALIRHCCNGSYKELAYKMTLDNFMMDYLDNEANTKWNPNENYAREFLELFTIGKGPQIGPGDYSNYKEEDVLAGAKLLTGFRRTNRDGNTWSSSNIDPDTGLHQAIAHYNRHETSDKTFSSHFQNMTITSATTAAEMYDELQDYVDMIFAQDETAKNIVRKIYRHFVARDISTEIENDIIVPLANTFRNSNYDLPSVMKQLFKSQHFFGMDDNNASDDILGRIIKSPLEQTMQTLTFFNVGIPDPTSQADDHYNEFWRRSIIEVVLDQAGLEVFRPSSVAGYPAYYQEPQFHRNWFSSSTIIARYKVPEMILKNRRLLSWGDFHGTFDIVQFVRYSGVCTNPSQAADIVDDIIDYLLVETPDASRRDYFIQTILDGLPDFDWTEDWNDYVSGTAPDDSAVRAPLDRFFKALLYSPEWQCM